MLKILRSLINTVLFAMIAGPGLGQTNVPMVEQNDLYKLRLTAAEALFRHFEIGKANEIMQEVAPKDRGWEWHLLNSRMHRAAWRRQVGTAVTCVASTQKSPSNSCLWAAGTDQNKVLIGDFDSDVVREIDLKNNQPTSIQFDDQGNRLLVAARNGHLSVYSVKDLKEIQRFSGEFTKAVYEACWSDNSERIAAVSWELTGKEIPVLGFVKIFDVGTGKCIHKIGLDNHPASSVQISKDMKRIFTGTWGEAVYCHSLDTGKEIWKLDLGNTGQYAAVQRIRLSARDQFLGVVGKDSRIRIADPASGEVKWQSREIDDHRMILNTLAFDPVSGNLSTAGDDGLIKIWWAAGMSLSGTLPEHLKSITSVVWVDDHTVLSGGRDGLLCKFDLRRSGEDKFSVMRHGPWDLPVSHDGEWMAAPGSDDTIVIRRLSNPGTDIDLIPHSGNAGAFSVDARYFASGGHDNIVSVYDRNEKREISQLKGHGSSIYGISFAHQGYRFLSAGGSAVFVWEIGEANPIHNLQFPGHAIYKAVFDPKDEFIYAAAMDGMIFVCSSRSGTKLDSLACKAPVRQISLHPQLPLLVAGGENGSYEVWNTQTKSKVSTLTGHSQPSYGVTFHPQTPRVVTCSYDRSVRVWNAYSGETLLSMKFDDELYNVALINGGTRLVLTETEGIIHVIDLQLQ